MNAVWQTACHEVLNAHADLPRPWQARQLGRALTDRNDVDECDPGIQRDDHLDGRRQAPRLAVENAFVASPRLDTSTRQQPQDTSRFHIQSDLSVRRWGGDSTSESHPDGPHAADEGLGQPRESPSVRLDADGRCHGVVEPFTHRGAQNLQALVEAGQAVPMVC